MRHAEAQRLSLRKRGWSKADGRAISAPSLQVFVLAHATGVGLGKSSTVAHDAISHKCFAKKN